MAPHLNPNSKAHTYNISAASQELKATVGEGVFLERHCFFDDFVTVFGEQLGSRSKRERQSGGSEQKKEPQESLCCLQTAVVLLLCDLEGLLPRPPFRAFTPVSLTSRSLGSSSQVIN